MVSFLAWLEEWKLELELLELLFSPVPYRAKRHQDLKGKDVVIALVSTIHRTWKKHGKMIYCSIK